MRSTIALITVACLVGAPMYAFSQQAQRLRAGSVVSVELREAVSSERRSSDIAASVMYDVVAEGGEVVISAGTPVRVRATTEPRAGVGRPGIVDVEAVSTTTVDGQTVALRGGETVNGRNKRGRAIGLGVGLGVLAWPFLAILALKGGEAVVADGAILDAETTQAVF